MPAIQRARNARLVAVASRTAARAREAADALGIPRAHGSYEALLEDPEIDAVYIPLPNTLHRAWTLRCAAAGQLVLAAFTFQAREPRTNIRFRPDLGGGALYDVGCYAVNIARAVLGEPQEVFAYGRVGRYGVDEVVGGLLRFETGRLAAIDCSLTVPRREEYEVVGSEGRLVVPHAFLPGAADAEIHLTRGAERTVITLPGADQYQRMVEHFGDAVSGGPLSLPPTDAVGNLRVLAALHTSLRTGAPEAVAR